MYALEAMCYMTAGIADVQKKDDILLESAMCKIFACQVSRFENKNNSKFLKNHLF